MNFLLDSREEYVETFHIFQYTRFTSLKSWFFSSYISLLLVNKRYDKRIFIALDTIIVITKKLVYDLS